MANTTEVLRLMRHAADLLDACEPDANVRALQGVSYDSKLIGAASRRASAEAVAIGSASMVLRMVAAALDDEPDQGGGAAREAPPNDLDIRGES